MGPRIVAWASRQPAQKQGTNQYSSSGAAGSGFRAQKEYISAEPSMARKSRSLGSRTSQPRADPVVRAPVSPSGSTWAVLVLAAASPTDRRHHACASTRPYRVAPLSQHRARLRAPRGVASPSLFDRAPPPRRALADRSTDARACLAVRSAMRRLGLTSPRHRACPPRRIADSVLSGPAPTTPSER